MAAVFSCYVAIIAVARGSTHYDQYDLSLGAIIVTYFVGGVAGGAVVGVLRPLTKYFVGAALVGLVAALPLAMAVGVATHGDPRHWSADNWDFVRFFLHSVGTAVGGHDFGGVP